MDDTRDLIEKLMHSDIDDATEQLPMRVWCPVWGHMCGFRSMQDGGTPTLGIRSDMDVAAQAHVRSKTFSLRYGGID